MNREIKKDVNEKGKDRMNFVFHGFLQSFVDLPMNSAC